MKYIYLISDQFSKSPPRNRTKYFSTENDGQSGMKFGCVDGMTIFFPKLFKICLFFSTIFFEIKKVFPIFCFWIEWRRYCIVLWLLSSTNDFQLTANLNISFVLFDEKRFPVSGTSNQRHHQCICSTTNKTRIEEVRNPFKYYIELLIFELIYSNFYLQPWDQQGSCWSRNQRPGLFDQQPGLKEFG